MADKNKKIFRNKFAGGLNNYLGSRQIKEDESPDMTNCDFKGKGGVGNRQGYSEIGSPDATNNDGVVGMGALHTASLHQLLRFAKNGSTDVKMEYSTGGAFTQVADTFAASLDIDVCQAASKIYTGNGSDVMHEWDGAAWAHTSNGTIGYAPTYYNQRLWVIDETNKDRINFSGQYSEQLLTGGGLVNKLGDFADATAGWISFKFGSGAEVTGLKVFKDSLYVFLRDCIYKINPATTANTFTITQITSSVGCVSHRSITQVEEDLYFASDDGVYALGEVANYVSVRTTNKSSKIQQVFNGLSATQKSKLVGAYFNFKYHLFYSLFGVNNDSCVAYDIRYQGWVDWRNMPCNSATLYIDSDNDRQLYIGNPTNSEVYQMYSGATDNGSTISTIFYTKSYDEDEPDVTKIYFDHTFIFGEMNGTVNISVVFDDSMVTSTKSLSQTRPQGGFGRDAYGKKAYGDATNTVTVTNYVGIPLRMTVSEPKFAVQYKITSSGAWRLDGITTTYKPLPHAAFPAQYTL